MFAAGNGGVLVKDSCAFNGYVNNIYTVAISGIKGDGSIPVFGEPCTGIIAVTYTKDIFEGSKVVRRQTVLLRPRPNTYILWTSVYRKPVNPLTYCASFRNCFR